MNQTISNFSNNTVNANTVNRPAKYQSREKDHCCLRGLKFLTSLIAAPFIGLHYWYTIRLARRKVTKTQPDQPSDKPQNPEETVPCGITVDEPKCNRHQSQSMPKSIETNANRCQTPNSQRPAPASLPSQRLSSYNGSPQTSKGYDDDFSDDEDAGGVNITKVFRKAMENKSLPINEDTASH
jgi:hypothetical protein